MISDSRGSPFKPEQYIFKDTERTLLLIDWSNLMYRAWFSSKEKPWLAYCRFFDMLRTCIHKAKQPGVPLSIIFCGESRDPLIRSKIDPSYKANRKPPENMEFREYRKNLANLISNVWLFLSISGAEADDVIASIVASECHRCTCKIKCVDCHCADAYKTDVIIFSGDRDMQQLLAWDRVLIWRYPGIFVSRESFEEEYGFPVKYFEAYKALVGDKSDNILGVPGWGPVRATKAILDGTVLEELDASGQRHLFEKAKSLVALDTKINLKPIVDTPPPPLTDDLMLSKHCATIADWLTSLANVEDTNGIQLSISRCLAELYHK